jgi:arylsulfatase A-like enzyme
MVSETVHSRVPPFTIGAEVPVERAESGAIVRAARLLLMAVWFGLLAGLLEASHLTVRIFFLHQIIGLSRHIVWMAPLADAFLFAVVGLFLFPIAWRWPKLISLRVSVFIFAFLSFLSLLISYPLFHRYAVLLLALGLAVQTARLISRRADKFQRLVQRTTWCLAALVLGLAVGIYGWQYLGERRALAQLPTAAPNAPNVLLITLDTVRAQSLSLYGYGRPTTPQLERLSKNGVRFDLALSTAPWTLPSHATMFTGRFDHELSVDWLTSAAINYPTLAEGLSQRGYRTAGFVANYSYCTYESGLDRGFARYEDYKVSPGEILVSSSLARYIINSHHLRRLIGYHEIVGRKDASQLNQDFLNWLSRPDQRPFFAFVNYFDAHEPYLPPKAWETKFGPNSQRRNDLLRYWAREASRSEKESMSPLEIQGEIDAYDAAIAYMDHQLGMLFDELERRGALKNTVVIITSDHGELFGEHGIFTHANNVYLPAVHVPLLVSFPERVPAGKTVAEAVSLRDIPATVLDLVKVNDARFPGASLARFWDGTNVPGAPSLTPVLSELKPDPDMPASSPASKGDSKSLVAEGYHYIKRGDGVEELYIIEKDPLETHDLSGAEESRKVLDRFRASLKMALSGH